MKPSLTKSRKRWTISTFYELFIVDFTGFSKSESKYIINQIWEHLKPKYDPAWRRSQELGDKNNKKIG